MTDGSQFVFSAPNEGFRCVVEPPDEVAQMMKDNGVQAYSLHRNLDDPNSLMCLQMFEDRETAEAFMNLMGPAMEAREDAGALEPGSLTWWLGEDVPGYSSKP